MKKNIINFCILFVWVVMLVSNNVILCLLGAVICILHLSYFVGEKELEEEQKNISTKYKPSNI